MGADRWARERREKSKKLVSMLTDSVNGGMNGGKIDEEVFLDGMMRCHRTLQQRVMQLILRLIWKWAEVSDTDGRCYDLRNEATVKLCAQIRDAVGIEGNVPVLPYV